MVLDVEVLLDAAARMVVVDRIANLRGAGWHVRHGEAHLVAHTGVQHGVVRTEDQVALKRSH